MTTKKPVKLRKTRTENFDVKEFKADLDEIKDGDRDSVYLDIFARHGLIPDVWRMDGTPQPVGGPRLVEYEEEFDLNADDFDIHDEFGLLAVEKNQALDEVARILEEYDDDEEMICYQIDDLRKQLGLIESECDSPAKEKWAGKVKYAINMLKIYLRDTFEESENPTSAEGES